MGELRTAKLTEEFIRLRLLDNCSKGHVNEKKSAGYFNNSSAEDEFKCAAVLIPLIQHKSNWSLVFTRRTDQVGSHKGQVSFPGGACEFNEIQAEDTALREAWEEIGVKREEVKILGKLADVETITNFRVTPVVGKIPWPYDFKLSKQEVSRVFTIPLDWLIQSSNWVEQIFIRKDIEKEYSLVTYLPYDGEILWGASARITHNFLKALDLI